MDVVSYKCPCCSAPLAFSGKTQKLECAACGNSYDTETIESMAEDDSRENTVNFKSSETAYSPEDEGAMKSYTCQFCGAELVTDGTTSATECAYCGSPAIIPAQLTGGARPEKVIPFTVSKEKATQLFNDYFKKKKLIPDIFENTQNRIAEMRRLYAPFWLYSCEADANVTYNAEQVMVTRHGDWEETRTRHYLVRRAGSIAFDDIPVDGSEKLDDNISESLEPYDFSGLIDFTPAALAGAMADKADVDSVVCRSRAVERLVDSTAEAFRDTVEGYSSVTVRTSNISAKEGTVTPVLLPVWLITTEKTEKGQKKTYTFAINGQTGKLTCDVPYSKAKWRKWFFSLAGGITVAGYILFTALAYMGVIR